MYKVKVVNLLATLLILVALANQVWAVKVGEPVDDTTVTPTVATTVKVGAKIIQEESAVPTHTEPAPACSKGEKGDQGEPGTTGPAGPQGPQGEKGANGLNGRDGCNGRDGKNGSDGRNGCNGRNGIIRTVIVERPANPSHDGVYKEVKGWGVLAKGGVFALIAPFLARIDARLDKLEHAQRPSPKKEEKTMIPWWAWWGLITLLILAALLALISWLASLSAPSNTVVVNNTAACPWWWAFCPWLHQRNTKPLATASNRAGAYAGGRKIADVNIAIPIAETFNWLVFTKTFRNITANQVDWCNHINLLPACHYAQGQQIIKFRLKYKNNGGTIYPEDRVIITDQPQPGKWQYVPGSAVCRINGGQNMSIPDEMVMAMLEDGQALRMKELVSMFNIPKYQGGIPAGGSFAIDYELELLDEEAEDGFDGEIVAVPQGVLDKIERKNAAKAQPPAPAEATETAEPAPVETAEDLTAKLNLLLESLEAEMAKTTAPATPADTEAERLRIIAEVRIEMGLPADANEDNRLVTMAHFSKEKVRQALEAMGAEKAAKATPPAPTPTPAPAAAGFDAAALIDAAVKS